MAFNRAIMLVLLPMFSSSLPAQMSNHYPRQIPMSSNPSNEAFLTRDGVADVEKFFAQRKQPADRIVVHRDRGEGKAVMIFRPIQGRFRRMPHRPTRGRT
jgi:hypothetical protein